MRAILIFFLLFSSYVQANCHDTSSCDYIKDWSDFTKFVAEYSSTRNGDSTKFEYLQVDNEFVVNISSSRGITTVLTINNIGTLYKNIGATGFKTAQECQSDVGDTTAILQSYAVQALYFIGIGSQLTPTVNSGEYEIKYLNEGEDSRVQINPGDHMLIGSPWSLSGSLIKGQGVSYNIHHQNTFEGELVDEFVKGSWSNTPVANDIDDEVGLDDWLICIGGKYSYENQESKFSPYITNTSNINTIGDLRVLSTSSAEIIY